MLGILYKVLWQTLSTAVQISSYCRRRQIRAVVDPRQSARNFESEPHPPSFHSDDGAGKSPRSDPGDPVRYPTARLQSFQLFDDKTSRLHHHHLDQGKGAHMVGHG